MGARLARALGSILGFILFSLFALRACSPLLERTTASSPVSALADWESSPSVKRKTDVSAPPEANMSPVDHAIGRTPSASQTEVDESHSKYKALSDEEMDNSHWAASYICYAIAATTGRSSDADTLAHVINYMRKNDSFSGVHHLDFLTYAGRRIQEIKLAGDLDRYYDDACIRGAARAREMIQQGMFN